MCMLSLSPCHQVPTKFCANAVATTGYRRGCTSLVAAGTAAHWPGHRFPCSKIRKNCSTAGGLRCPNSPQNLGSNYCCARPLSCASAKAAHAPAPHPVVALHAHVVSLRFYPFPSCVQVQPQHAAIMSGHLLAVITAVASVLAYQATGALAASQHQHLRRHRNLQETET